MGLKAKKPLSTDYETYREIMGELLCPIMADGLDLDTLKRLYVSKSVYLENLRMKCFIDLNKENSRSYFTWKDYEIIVKAIEETHNHLRKLILVAVSTNLDKRKVC